MDKVVDLMEDETIKEIFEIITNMDIVKEQIARPEYDASDPVSSIVNVLNIVSEAFEDQNVVLDRLQNSISEALRYKKALDHSALVSITDPEGNIKYVNDLFCELSGYSKRELIGQNHSILKSKKHKSTFWNGLWQIISQGNVWQNEIHNLSKEGIGYWVDVTIIPFLDQKGEASSYLSMSRDITKKKNKELETTEYHTHLESINKNLEQFAHTVSHDLKSPLNNAKGLLTIVEGTLGPDVSEETKMYIELLKDTNEKMRGLIDGILSYSKASGRDRENQKIDLKAFILEVGNTLIEKGKLDYIFKTDFPTVMYNEVVLKQVLSNLLSNAIKFNNKDRCIVELSCNEDDHYYHISIYDNGPGVAKEFQEEMFKLFNKVNENAEIDSSGVGLATVKKIINESGGNIWVNSEVGYGTEFIFTIRKKPRTIGRT